MGCPHCESTDTSERRERTALGYRRFRQQFWASEKVEEPRGIKVGSYCA